MSKRQWSNGDCIIISPSFIPSFTFPYDKMLCTTKDDDDALVVSGGGGDDDDDQRNLT